MQLPASAEPYIRQQRTEIDVADYARTIENEIDELGPWLVRGDCLDIGCGVGYASALIAQRCGGRLHALDGDGGARRRAGFAPQMQAFNSLGVTRSTLEMNGVCDYRIWPIGAKQLPAVDTVVSLLSWGWHYPISSYIDALRIREGGVVIADLREGTDGWTALATRFEFETTVRGVSGKGQRTVWRA